MDSRDQNATAEGVVENALNNLWVLPEDPLDWPDWREVPAKLVAALRAAGFAVVQLPEPDNQHGEWFQSDAWSVWIQRGHRVQIRTQGYGLPNETRAFGAALLAAANAAELSVAANAGSEEERP